MVRSILMAVVVMTASTLVGCGQPMAVVAPAAQQPQARAQAMPTGESRAVTLAKAEIKRFDTNRNGSLSSKEYVDGRFGEMRFIKAPTAAETASLKAGLAKTFAKLDLNKDGQLAPQELAAEYTAN